VFCKSFVDFCANFLKCSLIVNTSKDMVLGLGLGETSGACVIRIQGRISGVKFFSGWKEVCEKFAFEC
jgi:hypothetical protein